MSAFHERIHMSDRLDTTQEEGSEEQEEEGSEEQEEEGSKEQEEEGSGDEVSLCIELPTVDGMREVVHCHERIAMSALATDCPPTACTHRRGTRRRDLRRRALVMR